MPSQIRRGIPSITEIVDNTGRLIGIGQPGVRRKSLVFGMFAVARAALLLADCHSKHGEYEMAPSAAKMEANRRNAQKSTGPRTEEGKGRSKMNALNLAIAPRPWCCRRKTRRSWKTGG